jgi:hypothetical protein
LCKEGWVQKAAVLEMPFPSSAAGADRLRQLVLVRIAAGRGVAKAEVAADLAPFAKPDLPPGQWQARVEREIEYLAAAGLVTVRGDRLEAGEAGAAQAARFLGIRGALPRAWGEVRDVRLVAKALARERQSAKRLAALAAPEGLRAAIVARAYRLQIKGAATPTRLREALAATALRRAFGDKSTAGLAGKLGLSAKAGRLLAAQLSTRPRDFGTDSRLVAALAAEYVGAGSSELAALRQGLLRQFFGSAPEKVARVERAPTQQRPPAQRPPPRREPATPPPHEALRPAPPSPPRPAIAVGRPDLPGFASEVRRHAASQAHGWSGDRKAYISHVWRNIRDRRPEWGLSEIEFKCMLAEAHRTGQLALANADLKDKSNIQDVQDSAVVYRNAVFHFIRVDA